MPIALVQTKTSQATSATQAATFDTPPTPGNTIIVIFGSSTAAGTPQDIATFNRRLNLYNSGNTPSYAIFDKVAGIGEPSLVTGTLDASATGAMHIFEYSGIDPINPVDKTISNGSGVSGVTTGSTGTTPTTTQAEELILAAIGLVTSGTSLNTWTNSFTEQTVTTRLFTAHRIVAAAAAFETTNTWVTARRFAGGIVTYKAPQANKGNFLSLL